MPSFCYSNDRFGAKSLAVKSIQILATVSAVLLTLTVSSRALADEVTRWNQIATDATTAADEPGLKESLVFSILHVAIHDAANAVDSRYEPYLPRTSPPAPGASVEVAVASAAHATLVALLPASKDSFDAALEESLRTISDESKKSAGRAVGQSAAAAILATRENDGSSRTVQYTAGTNPGEYCPTPPDFKPAAMAHWGGVKPFTLESSAQFRPPEPPAVDSARARADLEEVKAMGGIHSVTRTAEQSEIARYWYENSTRGWNRIAREVSSARQLDPWENARLFALVNLAMADGYIANFDSKYHYHYWRPITAIRHYGKAF